MKLQKGDKVSFLNETGGGTIVKIIDDETVSVLNEDGFEIPVLKSDVILQRSWNPEGDMRHKEQEPEADKQPAPFEKETESQEEVFYTDSSEINIYLAAVPNNQKHLTDEGYGLYLINDSNYFLQYNISKGKAEDFKLFKGEIEPNLKLFLESVPREAITEDTDLLFQAIFFDQKSFTSRPPLSKEVKLKAAKLFKEGAYKPNDFFDERAIIFSVLEDNPMQKAIQKLEDKAFAEKIKQQKTTARTPEKSKKKHTKTGEYKEVDLHIQELLDDETGLSDADKLNYQMDRFRSEMDEALKKGYPGKIVFIHGIGGGSLKHRIRRELQKKYKSCLFQDASYAEYGYGATMVLIRKPKQS